MYDKCLNDYKRNPEDLYDSAWIQEAIDDNPEGVLCIPKGEYKINEPLFIRNHCSLEMHPQAKLIAVKEMDFVLTYDGNMNYVETTLYNEDGTIYDNLNIFIKGGDIDGNGLASCLILANSHHYTLSDITLHNGKKYGLCVGGPIGGRLYELVATNVYCKCTMKGLGGNIGIYTNESDGHFTDCFVIDYTIGIQLDASSNRLTRCHIWGGTIPPKAMDMKEWAVQYALNKKIMLAGGYDDEMDKAIVARGVPEMLENSISFVLNSGANFVDGCYADTATIGYLVKKDSNVITNSGFYNNKLMGLRNTLAVKNESGNLVVSNCAFVNGSGTDRFYEGGKDTVKWVSNNVDLEDI